MRKIGFIGAGNMGGALASAVCKSVSSDSVYISDFDMDKAAALASSLSCHSMANDQIAGDCEVIFLGVKPQVMESVVSSIAPVLARRSDRFVLVTMAAGLECKTIAGYAGGEYPVIRVMPNTPAAIGKGVLQYCGLNTTQDDFDLFEKLMANEGLVDALPEALIDAASAVSGCGPAFCYLFIEALADGAVACGLPRDKALKYAAQMVSGSAEMVLKSGIHPGVLKDQVCSPGGTTIQGVKALEAGAFRSDTMAAVIAAYEKSRSIK